MNKHFLKKFFHLKSEEEEVPLSQVIREQEQLITEYERKMILNIVSLSNINVKEIMVPRVDVVCVDINSDINKIIEIVEEKGKSRLPVYNDNIDNIVGMLHAKDLLKYFTKKEVFNLSDVIRQAFFIPESKQINTLLVEMREKKNHLAIVVDEYGGFSGIICLEDIIEKIVGEIQDEFDNEVEDIIQIDENQYIINARISIEELNEKIGTHFDDDEIDTLGGLIYMLFGRIPALHDKIQYKQFIFTIEVISGRKIEKIKMQVLGDINEDNS